MKRAIARNKKATHDFQILETYEAGIILKGPEVKSIREGKVSIKDSFARIENGEVYLYHMSISPYQPSSSFAPPPERRKKLLLKKTEIHRLEGKLSGGGLTLIPLSIYIKQGWIKVELALARGARKYEKRDKIKKREVEREISRMLKSRR